MLQSYFPLYQIALDLEALRSQVKALKDLSRFTSKPSVTESIAKDFASLLKTIHQRCLEYGLSDTSDMAKRLLDGIAPDTYDGMFADLNHLNGSLSNQLQKEAVFRVEPELKKYYEHGDLFGPKVAAAFPSCERDIQRAGSCYALGQGDASVHHLMLVLERGLNALAVKVGAQYQRTNWQTIIDQITSKLKSAPKGPERDFYNEVNAQFGLLKVTYRNHSEHVRDERYDMPKTLHILNHVREFMQELANGGLSEMTP